MFRGKFDTMQLIARASAAGAAGIKKSRICRMIGL